MELRQYISMLKRQRKKLQQTDPPLRIASLATHQQVSKRIFASNVDVQRNPLVYKFPSGRKDLSGKTRKRDGAYSYYYAQFRKKKRRQIKKVDLFLTGDFRSDYMNSRRIGASTPRRLNVHSYYVGFFSRGKKGISHAQLAEVFETWFYQTRIFPVSKNETRQFYKIAYDELYRLLSTP